MPTVWFIRHAESEANKGLATAYPATIKLTPRGVEQARSIVQSFGRKEPHLIITSPYQRTLETAQPTLQRFPTAEHEQWPVHEFTYLTSLEVITTFDERRPQADAFWERNDPFYIDGSDTESFVGFISRVQQIIKLLRQAKKDFIAVFSHEQFIRAVQWLLLNKEMEPGVTPCPQAMRHFKNFLDSSSLPNGAIVPVVLQDGEESWVSKIITTHLPETF